MLTTHLQICEFDKETLNCDDLQETDLETVRNLPKPKQIFEPLFFRCKRSRWTLYTYKTKCMYLKKCINKQEHSCIYCSQDINYCICTVVYFKSNMYIYNHIHIYMSLIALIQISFFPIFPFKKKQKLQKLQTCPKALVFRSPASVRSLISPRWTSMPAFKRCTSSVLKAPRT